MNAWILLLMLVLFALIFAWAFARRNRQRFEDASRIPFLDDKAGT